LQQRQELPAGGTLKPCAEVIVFPFPEARTRPGALVSEGPDNCEDERRKRMKLEATIESLRSYDGVSRACASGDGANGWRAKQMSTKALDEQMSRPEVRCTPTLSLPQDTSCKEWRNREEEGKPCMGVGSRSAS